MESAKIIIVFDTCSLRSNLRESNSLMESFRNLCCGACAKVALPQVVFDELNGYLAHTESFRVSKFNNAVNAIRTDFENFKNQGMLTEVCKASDFQSLMGLKAINLSAESRRRKTHAQLDRLLGNFELLPYPALEHKDVVDRCLRERRPFKKLILDDNKNKDARYNDGGYRDTLIWHTICFLAANNAESVVVLVSNNTNDFGDGKGQLHEDLLADLEIMGIEKQRVLYFAELDPLNSFLTVEATKRAERVSATESEKIRSLISEKAPVPSGLKQSIETQDISDVFLGALLDVLDVLDDQSEEEGWISRSTFDNFELLTVSDQCETRVQHPNQVIIRANYFARLVTVHISAANRSDKKRFYRGCIITVDLFCDNLRNKILVVSPRSFAQDPLFECFVRTRPGTKSGGPLVLIVEPKSLATKAKEREFINHEEFVSCMLKLGADYRTLGSSDSSNMNAFSIPTAARSLLIKFGMLSE